MKLSWAGLGVIILVAAGCSRRAEEAPMPAETTALAPSVRAAAAEQGKKIVDEAFQLLSSNLQSAMQSGGISNALSYCSVAAAPLTRTVAEQHGVEVRRFTHKPRNPQGKAEGVEMTILKAFEASLLSTNMPSPIITNVTPGKVTFFAPILLRQPICLKCHGEPGKDIQPEHLEVIKRLYPQDQAMGFRAGELRGAWRVDIPLATLEQRN